jgi:hypothetical protein
MTRRAVLFIGEAPSRRSDPRIALGERGRDWMCAVSGMPRAHLEARADFANLLQRWPGASASKGSLFPADEAAAAAREMDLRGRRLVALCGRRAASAFGLHGMEYLASHRLAWTPMRGARAPVWMEVCTVPHPSGVNQWWNSADNRERFADWLWSALE